MKNLFLAMAMLLTIGVSAQIPTWFDINGIDIKRNGSTIFTYPADSSVGYFVMNRDTNGVSASCVVLGDSAQYYRCTFISKDSTWVATNVPVLPAPQAGFAVTYAQASALSAAGGLLEGVWYNITDDSIYLQAITDTLFALNGYYADSAIWEVDAIEFDFANEHIQKRCDKRGNCVGAAFGIIDNGLISVDPITVFVWGDDFIVGNTVKDAVLDLTNIVGVGDAFIVDNYVTQQSEVVVGNNGPLQFQKNIVEIGTIWTSIFCTGLIIENVFTNGIDVNTDSTDMTLMQQNNMYGASMYFHVNGSSGNFLANDGQGHLQSRYSVDCNIRDNNFFNGSYIFADSLTGDLNTNELHRGSEIHMVKSDSAFSKNYLDFTAIVKADSTHNRTEYNRFIGGSNGFGTTFNAKMSTVGQLINTHVISAGNTVTFNPDTIYNQRNINITQKLSLGTTNANATLTVDGSIIYLDGNETAGYVLTSDASGNATWQDPTGYGEMGFGDSLRTIAITQNVFSVVTNSNNTLWSTAAIDLHNVTYSGDSLIIDSAGVYQINAQLSVEGTNASIIRMGVFINGALACTCTGWQQLSNNQIVQLTYINIDTLNVGDVVQVVIANTANSDDVDAVGGKVMVNKIR
jgi:hypothetical protein